MKNGNDDKSTRSPVHPFRVCEFFRHFSLFLSVTRAFAHALTLSTLSTLKSFFLNALHNTSSSFRGAFVVLHVCLLSAQCSPIYPASLFIPLAALLFGTEFIWHSVVACVLPLKERTPHAHIRPPTGGITSFGGSCSLRIYLSCFTALWHTGTRQLQHSRAHCQFKRRSQPRKKLAEKKKGTSTVHYSFVHFEHLDDDTDDETEE